jgi:quercetin 2,3-dioxygenase
MPIARKILKVFKSEPVIEGAGVHLKRAFGFGEVPTFDPFLLLDDFRTDKPEYYLKGFPWHPHRGIETITYVLKGEVEHGDSLGNTGVIQPGDVQWMTAGSGIIHQEMPKGGKDNRMFGFQLWANLPTSDKMIHPKYRDVKSGQIPEIALDNGIKVKIICGEFNGVSGPVHDIVIDPEYMDITVPPEQEFHLRTKKGHSVFTYVIEGKGYFCKEKNPFSYEVDNRSYFNIDREAHLSNEDLVEFDDKGDEIVVITEDKSFRFLFVSGKPLKEPIAWQGPIVMNTQDELRTAFDEYRKGIFLKHKN